MCNTCGEKCNTRTGTVQMLVCVCPPYGPPVAVSPSESPATNEPPTAATSPSTSLAAQRAADQSSAVPAPAADSLSAATWLETRVREGVASLGLAHVPALESKRCKVQSCKSDDLNTDINVKLCLHVLTYFIVICTSSPSQRVPAHTCLVFMLLPLSRVHKR